MAYLGLDLSLSSTGVFILRDDGTCRGFEICTDPKRYPSLLRRCISIAEKIIEETKNENIDLTLMETYYVGQFAHSVISLAVLGTLVRDRLLASGYRYIEATPSQIKKFESGSGTSKKGNMVKCVFKNHSYDTASDNIADACAAAYLCRGYADWAQGKTDFLQYQKEVLKGMKNPIELPYSSTSKETTE